MADTGDRDFYWYVLTDDWLDFQKKPKHSVGSLVDDDIVGLERLARASKPPDILDLERMSAVLKLLAEDLGSDR